jgi:hypothetical protein
MIQFNLLPDVKLEYIKTERVKQLVVTLSFLASAAALALLIILVLTVDVWQKKSLHDVSADIKTTSKQLESTPDLSKILTVQNQLGQLTSLHDQKYVDSRLFGFLSQVTPTQATISNMTTDNTQNTMTISGDAPSLDVVNTFVDGLKFTKYRVDGSADSKNAFSNVVLSNFGRSNQGATYTITLAFDPGIFSNSNKVTLNVPDIVTTRSVIEQPSALFNQGGEQ